MSRIWGALAVAVLTPCLLGAQSLADAARQEKERREKARESSGEAKLYGERDLAESEGSVNSLEARDGAAAPAGGPHGPGGPDIGELESELEGKSREVQEAIWRKRAAATGIAVTQARKAYDEASALRPGPGMPPAQVDAIQGAAKQAFDAAEQAQADMKDEARRAGVPPGWLR